MDDLVCFSSKLRILSQGLIKTAKDLRLLSSGPQAGFAEIALPAVQDGSSFFIAKVNPVIPETLIQACFQVLGYDRSVQAAFEHAELNLNVFEAASAKNLLDASAMLTAAVRLFTHKCIAGITANEMRCAQLASHVSV